MRRLSVVITNYNYRDFVEAAVESALALQWPDVEVVIVDDGSDDGSADIVRAYHDRARVVLTGNRGQVAATNEGFAMTTGDVVIFLDSDDMLPPDLPAHLALAWHPGVSKVQVRMEPVDRDGHRLGPAFPRFDPVPSPSDIRRWMERTSAYPTPPGSGNAYARWFLDRVFPLADDLGNAPDSALLASAPFLGDVVTDRTVRVAYRRHEANDSNLLAEPTRFTREVVRARSRWRFAQRVRGADPVDIDERPLFRSRELLQFRVAARRLDPGANPLPGDRYLLQIRDAVLAPVWDGPEPLLQRVLVAVWSVLVATAPVPVARWLIGQRFRKST